MHETRAYGPTFSADARHQSAKEGPVQEGLRIVPVTSRTEYDRLLREASARPGARTTTIPRMGTFYVETIPNLVCVNASLASCLGVFAVDSRQELVLNAHLLSGPISPRHLAELYEETSTIRYRLLKLTERYPTSFPGSTSLHRWIDYQLSNIESRMVIATAFKNVLDTLKTWINRNSCQV